MGFNVQQKATIDNYRSAKKLGFVLSDEAVAKLIKKEMEELGTVYPGFESLAKSATKPQIKQPAQPMPSSAKPSSSIFGSEIISSEPYSISIERTTSTYPETQLTEVQDEAINFLKDLTGEAETTFQNRENEAGTLSAVVNTWQEVFNKQYAKSTLKKELQMAKTDLHLLEQAGKGQLGYTDFVGNTHIRSFEDVFKSSRGVRFDEKAIADCSEKAEQFAAIKTSVEMINQTKQMLGYTTKGDVHSQMNLHEASKSIIKAFQLSGINSLEEMNKTLQDIEQKYKNHPDIKEYGGDFKIEKDNKGRYVIKRTATGGSRAEAPIEQLRIIAKEMGIRLDKALATALGIEYSENATAKEMANLTQQTYDKYQKEYESSFAKAYGKKDVKALSEAYVLKQQQGVANIEMGLNIASMALMVVPGGAVAASGWALKGALVAKHTATGAKIVKGLNLVGKAKTFVKGAQTLQKISQAASPFIMANMTLRPTELLEQLTSKNGMSAEEWKAWGEGILQNSIYMAAGIGAGKLAETGAAMYKTKALVSTLKSAGKSTDEILAMIKANPVKFPKEIVKSLNKVDNLAKTLQVTSEVALDIGSTILVNKALGNGEVLKQDVINSIAFAISGGVLQKQFAPLSTQAKVSFIESALKEYGINKVEAERILKTMDDISAGKIRVKNNVEGINTAQAGKVGVREAVAENPAENITPRVEKEVYKNEFKDEGMRLNTPERLESELREAESNPKAPTENVEALSMVASGKTKQLMAQRYNEMAKILDEIHTKYAKEIKQMESKYGSKPQVFAEHFMKFLADKMGFASCEPKFEFVKTEGDGAYDWQSGKLYLSDKLNNPKDIKTMIAHEFIHTLQFRNILAAYGREGVVELYLKHNDGKAIDELTRKYVKDEMEIELEDLGLSNAEVSALQRQVAEAYTDQCLGNEANARLLKHAQQNPVEKGSLNSYMARLQLDNLIKPEEFDTEAYYRSTNETEAYLLGNGQITGRNNSGRTEQKASERHSKSEAGISIPLGSTGSGNANRINLIKTINQIPVSGLEPKYEPIQGIVRKTLLQELNSDTNSSLPSKIIYEHHPAKPEGVAFISSEDNILHINISYFEHLGKNIDKGIKMLEAEGFLSKDINGKYKIPDYLRNSRTVEFESLLNSNPKSMSLDKQFHFFEESYKYTASLASQIKRAPIVTIEIIIKTGKNMELIKNAGLYKSRAEVSKMSIAEQHEYLKTLLTSESQIQIPSNAVREPYPELVFVHEIAHIKHNNSNQNAELKLTEKEWQENKEIQEICTRVSGYARKNQKEFLAEVYAGLQNGQEFHKSVMTLYSKSGGIIPEKILQSEAGISIP